MSEMLTVQTRSRSQMVNITSSVQGVVSASGIDSGLCHVFVPHTTAGVTIQENADPDVVTDFLDVLGRLVPQSADYHHVEGNSDSHVKASLVGSSVTIPITGGRLQLGTWQAVYFCEFDGPRTRKVTVTIIPTQR